MADLFPRPHHVELGPAIHGELPGLVTRHVVGMPSQAYELDVTATEAELRHGDEAGRRYGEQTYRQVRREVHIRDAPDLPVRGYMLDVSRDRVPTRETLARLVTLLELARFNQLQLYTEHTFAYRGHDVVWRDASPLTAGDVRWLDERCAGAGIELVANQNCFGHMARWLRHPEYRDRAECPDGFDLLPGMHQPPAVLQPTQDNADFALSLVHELLSAHRSRTVNIGCDETFELGRCRSADEVAARGAAAVYVEHLRRLLDPLVADGCHVQFWSDVVRAHPDALAQLPSDGVTALAWSYERIAPSPDVDDVLRQVGVDPEAHRGFDTLVAPLADAGVPFLVAPGTSTWNSLVGRVDNAVANIDDAVDVALRAGAGGVLLTDWGDNGHLQPSSVSFPPILFAGARAWNRSADVDLVSVLDGPVFGDDAHVLGGVLLRAGAQWGRTGRRSFNASPLQAALCPWQPHLVLGRPDLAAVDDVIEALDGCLADLERARPACDDGDFVVEELRVTVALARVGALRLRCDDRALGSLVDDYRTAWLHRSRPGGLDDSVAALTG